ncbi:thioredoxin-like protein [Amylocystis lapponica]|nr:thioredoxin-like protein [Amylocystis lapponica]
MKLSYLLTLTFAVAPSLTLAAIFPADSQVKMIDPAGFRQAMKRNETSVIAFVAPWCGHCQRMAPEYSKAAVGLSPMVPLYAVDCDADTNKRLCAEQGVQGFPTVKLFPRGKLSKPITYDGQRTARDIFSWASQNIPHGVKYIENVKGITTWADANVAKPRAVLFTANKAVPLVWRALGNMYKGQIKFASHRDRSGESAVEMGIQAELSEPSKEKSRIVIYPAGSTAYALYEGPQKYTTLVKFMKSVVAGTAELTMIQAKEAETSSSAPLGTPAEETVTPEATLNVAEANAVESEEGAGRVDAEKQVADPEPISAETAAPAQAGEAEEEVVGPGPTDHVKDEL